MTANLAASSSKVVALSFGPDTATYMIRPTDRNFEPIKQELSEELQEQLEALKKQAQEADEEVPTRWVFEDQTLFIQDKGGSQFKWILKNDKITLCIGRGKKTGIIGQLRLNSEYLWDCDGDLGLALTKAHLFLCSLYGEHILLDQSTLDLAVDVLGLDLSAQDIKEQFISRAVLDDENPSILGGGDGFVDGPSCIHRRWKKITGLTFGKHISVVSAVIYNKTDEIKYHSGKTWFHDIWRRKAAALGIEYSEDMAVWRIEVRFTRTAFREFPDVSQAFDVLNHVHDLWTYAVGHVGGGEDGLPDGWLRYVVPTEDTNRSRWPVHPDWEVIQHAFEELPLPETDYEREEREKQERLAEIEREKEELLAEVDAYLEKHPFLTPNTCKQVTPRRREQAAAPVVAPAPCDNRPFIRQRKREVNMEQGIRQVVGWLSTLEAWRGGYAIDQVDDPVENDLSDTLHFIMEQAEPYLQEEKQMPFSELVHKKRVRYRLEPAAVA